MHRQSVMLLLVKLTALWVEKIKWVVFQSSRNYTGSSANWKMWNHFPISLCLKMNNVVKFGIFYWCLFHIQFSENMNWKISLLSLLLVKETGCQKYGAGRVCARKADVKFLASQQSAVLERKKKPSFNKNITWNISFLRVNCDYMQFVIILSFSLGLSYFL